MKVLFVYADISGSERYGARKFYAGLGSLSAVLKAAGHETELLYIQREMSGDEFVERVDAARPDLLGFSTTTNQYPYAQRYGQHLKAVRPELPILCGGTHPTLVPEEVVSTGIFDIVCVGEGEYAMRELLARMAQGQDYADVQNLWLWRDGQIIRNTLRPLLTDLDELPYVDRELFEFDEIVAANDGWVDVMTGRGCPYNCSYCCNPGLKARYRGLGRYVRFRSVEHVMGELRELAARYPIKTINFQDDTFTLYRKWSMAFCEAYRAEFEYPFWINTRIENIRDESLVEALASAHCTGIRVGVENGDEELRTKVLGRKMSNDDIIAAFRLVQKHGLHAYTTNMIGIPGETPESIQATIDLNRELSPDQFQFSVFYPYPMTELHDTCVAQSLIRPDVELNTYYGRRSVLDLPTLTEEELLRGYDRFEALGAELALKRSSPWKHRLYMILLKLYRDDGPRLQKHLGALRRLRRRLPLGSRSAR